MYHVCFRNMIYGSLLIRMCYAEMLVQVSRTVHHCKVSGTQHAEGYHSSLKVQYVISRKGWSKPHPYMRLVRVFNMRKLTQKNIIDM